MSVPSGLQRRHCLCKVHFGDDDIYVDDRLGGQAKHGRAANMLDRDVRDAVRRKRRGHGCGDLVKADRPSRVVRDDFDSATRHLQRAVGSAAINPTQLTT